MKSAGFSLIEVIVGMALGAAIALVLFGLFRQTQRLARMLSTSVPIERSLEIFYDLFDKDITSCCIPPSSKQQKEKQKTSTPPTTPSDEADDKPFMCTTEKENVATITFITTHPLITYAETSPRLVRVLYELTENKNRPGTLDMTRKESAELTMKATKAATPYTILSGINKCSIRLLGIKEESKPSAQQPSVIQQEAHSWGTAETKDFPPLPTFVELKGTVQNRDGSREYPFICTTMILSPTNQPGEAAQVPTRTAEAQPEKPAEKPPTTPSTPPLKAAPPNPAPTVTPALPTGGRR